MDERAVNLLEQLEPDAVKALDLEFGAEWRGWSQEQLAAKVQEQVDGMLDLMNSLRGAA